MEENGLRLTGPRKVIIGAVAAKGERAFTGEALYEELRETGLGRATVFRTLKVLHQLGVLSRLHLNDGCQRYVLAPTDPGQGGHHHDRLICRECGQVGYLDRCPLHEALSGIAKASGYEIETHQLDLLGVCQDCRGKAGSGKSEKAGLYTGR